MRELARLLAQELKKLELKTEICYACEGKGTVHHPARWWNSKQDEPYDGPCILCGGSGKLEVTR